MRLVLGALLMAVLAAAAGCSAAVRGEPSNLGDFPQAAFHKVTASSRLPLMLLMSAGGGSGGISGQTLWAETWWTGSPEGPGPVIFPPAGGVPVCIWHDLGPGLANLANGLSEAGLPLSLWQQPDSGGHPGIWGVNEWALARMQEGKRPGHFDLVACQSGAQVPATGGDVEANLPLAYPPSGPPWYVWLFWDTVPDTPKGPVGSLIHAAFAATDLPSPVIGTSPSDVAGVPDSTVVNLPTWLWVAPGTWHTYAATAAGGGYVATVWAIPVSVEWTAEWSFPSAADDPQQGTTFGTEVLDDVCGGPGTVYDPEAPPRFPSCSFEFTQSTFGTYQPLRARVTWDVYWAVSDTAGVVGGEGSLGAALTKGVRPLRVMQVESVISSG